MLRCVISPLLFILVMKMKLYSAGVNTNEIIGPYMKAFMDDITLVGLSRSYMEQLPTGPLQMGCYEKKTLQNATIYQ